MKRFSSLGFLGVLENWRVKLAAILIAILFWFAVVTEGDKYVKELADHVIEIPETDEILAPLVSVVPLQLLAYHIAVLRKCNVDQPRNLAKSVTVE